MKFNEKVRLLKEKVGDKVLFVQNGNFYIAIGKDAVLLHELFNLKCTCFIKYLCKVGVPVRSLNKYLVALKGKEISYIVYKNINGELKVEENFDDANKNMKSIHNLGCENCKNAIYQYEREEIRKYLNSEVSET